MKVARLAVLGIAIVAGGIAALLAGRSDAPPAPEAPAPVAVNTFEVLVAKKDINIGQTVAAQDMEWLAWPMAATNPLYVRRVDRPAAIEQLAGAIARGPIAGGEPLRESKLIKAKGSGYMAAILPSGMRAVSTEISPETGAGGFILPNDRVDVILTKREKNADRPGAPDVVNSEVVLPNVRVLAIDQAPKEKDGQNTVIGKTVTLELRPEQAETLARARQVGTLSLALRSIADINMVENKPDVDAPKRGESVNVVRYGIASSTTTQK